VVADLWLQGSLVLGVVFVVQPRVEACVAVPQTQVQGMEVKPKTPAGPA
jgi:hypothetical protein